MTRNMDVTAVSNNSWGFFSGPGLDPSPRIWELAVERGISEGFDGKGVSYIFSKRMWAGTPRAIINSASMSMTSVDRMLLHARMARHSRVYSSMMEPHRPAVLGSDLDEVIGPHIVFTLGPQPHTGTVVQPQPPSPGLPGRHLQPLPPPDPLHPFVVHHPAAAPEQGGDPAVPVPAEPGGQRHDVIGQGLLVISSHRPVALGRSRMPQSLAGPPLGNSQATPDVFDTAAAAGGAQKFPSAASLRIWLSRVNSATALLSRPFSVSSCFRRRAGRCGDRRTRPATGRRSARTPRYAGWLQPRCCPRQPPPLPPSAC